MPILVYFYIIMINKYRQSAKRRLLLNRPTDRTFENRWSRYKEPSKNKAEAYRVYVELILRSDAGDASIFSKEMTHTDNQGDNDEQKEKRYYYHSDHLGSAQFVTDWRGKQYEHIEYTPYGELWVEETAPGIDKLPFRFTGKELDEETGLYYYGARYLDPKYSRWL
nr:RHS repeat-associated core domain-containing protein [Treponema pedis]